jgi:hypothetical protein
VCLFSRKSVTTRPDPCFISALIATQDCSSIRRVRLREYCPSLNDYYEYCSSTLFCFSINVNIYFRRYNILFSPSSIT